LQDPEEAVQAVKADPALVLQFNQRIAEIELEYYREDTERFKEIHQTIRAELSSQNPYNRRWRVTYVYFVAFSRGLLFLIFFCVVLYPMIWDKAVMAANVGAVKDLLAASWELWSMALTVLGYTIKKRTEDKHVAAKQHSSKFLEKTLNGYVNRPVRIRMQGDLGRGSSKLPFTRLGVTL
jgi:hypothetical protein